MGTLTGCMGRMGWTIEKIKKICLVKLDVFYRMGPLLRLLETFEKRTPQHF